MLEAIRTINRNKFKFEYNFKIGSWLAEEHIVKLFGLFEGLIWSCFYKEYYL